MNLFRIKIANQTIEVKAGYKDTSAWCRDFLTNDKPAFSITINQQDIEAERQFSLGAYPGKKFSGSYLEFMSLFKKIPEKIIDYNVLLMHGATISLNGESYIFTAPSGTGKTTHILKWTDNCHNAVVINGDKPFIKLNGDGNILACGSPWAGKESMYTNTIVPLKSIILMERSKENHIEQISFADAFIFLLQQT